jgi:hypothetical protein
MFPIKIFVVQTVYEGLVKKEEPWKNMPQRKIAGSLDNILVVQNVTVAIYMLFPAISDCGEFPRNLVL